MVFFLAILCPLLSAQELNSMDSTRTVMLEEVYITERIKEQQEQQIHFFRANSSATTEEILARLPELSLVRRGGYGMEPVIRGYGASQVNLTVDGMKIHGACTDRMDPASIYIEPVNLDRIEVRTGPGSILKGSAPGGTIDLQLAEAEVTSAGKLSGIIQSGYQSAANALYESLNLNYSGDRWALKGNIAYRKAGDYKDGKNRTVDYSQYEKLNYSVSAKYFLNAHTYLKADLLADDGWNIGYPALPMDVGYASARIASVSLVSQNPKKKWSRFETKLYANKIRHFMDDTQRPDVIMHMDMPGRSSTAGWYAEGKMKTGGRESLSVRTEVSLTRLYASMTMYEDGYDPMFMLTWPDNRNLQSAISAEYTWRVDSLTQVQLNSRADLSIADLETAAGKDQLGVFGYTGFFRQFFIPSAAARLSRQLGKSWQAQLGVTWNGRAPSASELYGFYLFNQFDGYDYIGNPGLYKESSLQGEATLNWKPSSRLQARVTGFVSAINNYIMGKQDVSLSTMTPGARGVKVFSNTRTAMMAGGEGSILARPLKNTRISSTLKYVYGEDAQGDPLPMINPIRSINAVRQQVKNLFIQTEYEVAGNQNRVSIITGEQQTGSFNLWHLRMGYVGTWNNMPWQLEGAVENIFNSLYREHLDWGKIPRPGRNLVLHFKLSF